MNISYIISICTSIFFLRFWIIFTIIMLYYFPCRLPIPFSFCCSEFFPCSFVCNIFLCSLVLSNFLHFCPSFHRLQDHSSSCFLCLSPGGWVWFRGLFMLLSVRDLCLLSGGWSCVFVVLMGLAISRFVFWGSVRSVWLLATCFLLGGAVFLSCCCLPCDFPALEPADCWRGRFLVLKCEPLLSIPWGFCYQDLAPTVGYSGPALPLEILQDSREVWPRFLWRYCFCARSQCTLWEWSLYFLQPWSSSTADLQDQMPLGFFFLLLELQTILEGYYKLRTLLCGLHESNIFWCEGCFYYSFLWLLSSVYDYPLDRRHDWYFDKNLHYILSRASPLLFGCHFTITGEVYSLVVVVKVHRSVS